MMVEKASAMIGEVSGAAHLLTGGGGKAKKQAGDDDSRDCTGVISAKYGLELVWRRTTMDGKRFQQMHNRHK